MVDAIAEAANFAPGPNQVQQLAGNIFNVIDSTIQKL